MDFLETYSQLAAEKIAKLEADKHGAYEERNRLVALLASFYPSGIARTDIPGWLPDWHGCVYIDLPNGQASWHFHDSHAHLFAHLPPYQGEWDGHTTEEKYRNIAELVLFPPDPDWMNATRSNRLGGNHG